MVEAQQIPGYRFVRQIAAGGMGSVYEVEKLATRRRLAAKYLHEHLAASPEYRARFEREVGALCSVRHPNVVNVFEWSLPPPGGGKPYLIMELLDGEGLDQVLLRTPVLPPRDAISVMLQVLDGLGAAHAARVIHRDLGPSNVFLVPQGNDRPLVKLLDFGLAGPGGGGEAGANITQQGTVMGKPAYIAPEMLLGRQVDSRSDIYACGVLLYRMLAGRLPYREREPELLWLERYADREKRGEYPPPSAEIPGLPPSLDAVAARAMRWDPADRYQTTARMQRDLLFADADCDPALAGPSEITGSSVDVSWPVPPIGASGAPPGSSSAPAPIPAAARPVGVAERTPGSAPPFPLQSVLPGATPPSFAPGGSSAHGASPPPGPPRNLAAEPLGAFLPSAGPASTVLAVPPSAPPSAATPVAPAQPTPLPAPAAPGAQASIQPPGRDRSGSSVLVVDGRRPERSAIRSVRPSMVAAASVMAALGLAVLLLLLRDDDAPSKTSEPVVAPPASGLTAPPAVLRTDGDAEATPMPAPEAGAAVESAPEGPAAGDAGGQTVRVVLSGAPAGCAAILGETAMTGVPPEARVPRSTVPTRLRIDAPGFRSYETYVVPHADITVSVELEAVGDAVDAFDRPADAAPRAGRADRSGARPGGGRRRESGRASTAPGGAGAIPLPREPPW